MTQTYTLKRSSRAKRLRITVQRDTSVLVTAPQTMSARIIDAFVQEKQTWIAKQQHYYTHIAKQVVPTGVTQGSYSACKARALQFVRTHVRRIANEHGLKYQNISVKNTTSQWGSCSPEGNLSFSYKLLFLPLEIAEYVIVHELAHTVELNHSHRFWRLVRSILPDYRKREHELKKYIL